MAASLEPAQPGIGLMDVSEFEGANPAPIMPGPVIERADLAEASGFDYWAPGATVSISKVDGYEDGEGG